MCSLDIHEWSFRYTQTHFSVIYQPSSQCAPISVHLASSSSSGRWLYALGIEDICSGLVSHSPRLSKCDPKVNCPCLLPGITRPRDLSLNWQRFLTVREMFSFAASSLHNLKCLLQGFVFSPPPRSPVIETRSRGGHCSHYTLVPAQMLQTADKIS